MKYYRLLTDDGYPKMKKGRVYPGDYKAQHPNDRMVYILQDVYPGDWIEVPKSEWLIQEAKERYKDGYILKQLGFNVGGKSGYEVKLVDFDVVDTNDNVRLFINGNHLIYNNGEWAEIISKPKQENKQEMEELKITKERVLSAAAKYTESEELLKELFPEVFDEEVFTKEGIKELECFIRASKNIKLDAFLKIPGYCSEEKAKSISKLIYETWIKE